jgi:hypothetical protein
MSSNREKADADWSGSLDPAARGEHARTARRHTSHRSEAEHPLQRGSTQHLAIESAGIS